MSPAQHSPVTFETVRTLALALPKVEEGTSYGTPAFRIGNKLLARLWEDGQTLVLKVAEGEQEMLIAAVPETFFITDHYRGYPAVLVRLTTVDENELRNLLERAWRWLAPKRLVAMQRGN